MRIYFEKRRNGSYDVTCDDDVTTCPTVMVTAAIEMLVESHQERLAEVAVIDIDWTNYYEFASSERGAHWTS